MKDWRLSSWASQFVEDEPINVTPEHASCGSSYRLRQQVDAWHEEGRIKRIEFLRRSWILWGLCIGTFLTTEIHWPFFSTALHWIAFLAACIFGAAAAQSWMISTNYGLQETMEPDDITIR